MAGVSNDKCASDDVRNVDKTDKRLPAIFNGKFFSVVKQDVKTITVKCMLCPNATLHAQTNATSNLLLHLKVTFTLWHLHQTYWICVISLTLTGIVECDCQRCYHTQPT